MSSIFQLTDNVKLVKIVNELANPKALARANKDPVKFFSQYGIYLPANIEYSIYHNDSNFYYFVLSNLVESEISHESLHMLQSGAGYEAHCKSSVNLFLPVSNAIANNTKSCAGTFSTLSTVIATVGPGLSTGSSLLSTSTASSLK